MCVCVCVSLSLSLRCAALRVVEEEGVVCSAERSFRWSGCASRPIFTWEKPTTGDDLIHKDEFRSECEHVSSITTNHIRACDLAQKVARIKLPLEKTWDTIRDAFDSIGYRVDL